MLLSIHTLKVSVLIACLTVIWSCAKHSSAGSNGISAEFVSIPVVLDELNANTIEPFGLSITNSSPDCSLAIGAATTPVYPDISILCSGTFFDVSNTTPLIAVPEVIVLYCPNSFAFSTALQFMKNQVCTLNHVYRLRLSCLQAGQEAFSAESHDLACIP